MERQTDKQIVVFRVIYETVKATFGAEQVRNPAELITVISFFFSLL